MARVVQGKGVWSLGHSQCLSVSWRCWAGAFPSRWGAVCWLGLQPGPAEEGAGAGQGAQLLPSTQLCAAGSGKDRGACSSLHQPDSLTPLQDKSCGSTSWKPMGNNILSDLLRIFFFFFLLCLKKHLSCYGGRQLLRLVLEWSTVCFNWGSTMIPSLRGTISSSGEIIKSFICQRREKQGMCKHQLSTNSTSLLTLQRKHSKEFHHWFDKS